MSHDHTASGEHKPHVLPLRTYFVVWAVLIVLTYVTVRVSYFDFGTMNLIVAMVVATVKASLVVMFFMHLKYDEPFNAVIFVGSLACLAIFFILTLADTVERGAVDPLEAEPIELVPARPDLMQSVPHGEEGAVPQESHEGGDEAAPEATHDEEAAPDEGGGGH